MGGNIEDRIEALSPKRKQLLLLKVKEAIAIQAKNTTTSGRKRIVAYVQGSAQFSVDQLRQELHGKLPDYMVPSQFVPVAQMPVLPNGKIDRKQLLTTAIASPKESTSHTSQSTSHTLEQQLVTIWEETLGFSPIHTNDNFFEIGGDSILSIQIIAKARKEGIVLASNALFEHQTIAELSLFAETTQSHDISVEEKLVGIWEETLGFSPIHTNDNFFEIGGDSILSIQIIAKARKEGIILESNHIFEHQTIAELSLFAKAETKEFKKELLQGIVPLSPIQQWFFEDHKNAPQYWNQGVRLDRLAPFSEKQLQTVCDYMMTQHDALRSRFRFEENTWIQDIGKPEQIFALEYVDCSGIAPEAYEQVASQHIQRIQDAFILSEGSLFKCIYFNTGVSTTNFCILIAHHLVVDAVSWQIITDDFINALQQVGTTSSITSEPKTSSITSWSEYLHRYADTIANDELDFWTSQITPVDALPYDIEAIEVIEEKDIKQLHFTLDKVLTKELLEANQAYNTKIGELLITAFIATISTWSNQDEVAIGFERHGRETSNSALDVSKTVGWFTSYFPMKFVHTSYHDLESQIVSVKEKMRSIPNGGIGYGALRYIKNAFGAIENPEIVFNFLGTKTTSVADHGMTVSTLTENLRDSRSERRYKLEINVQVIDEQLHGTFSYGSNVHTDETMTQLVNDFKERIQEIGTYCNQIENGGYTPSDFSDAEISQDDLDSLLGFLE